MNFAPGQIVEYRDWQGNWHLCKLIQEEEHENLWVILSCPKGQDSYQQVCEVWDIRPRPALIELAEAAE